MAACEGQIAVASWAVKPSVADVARAGSSHRAVPRIPRGAQALVLRVAQGVGHGVVGARIQHVGAAPAVGRARAARAAVEEVGGVAHPRAVADGASDPCVGRADASLTQH